MTHDQIVDEVRAVRDEIAKEHDYDIRAIFEALRRMEQASGTEHVSLPPRRTTQPGVAAGGRKADRG